MNTLMKYPRTYHLPWSLGVTSDDKLMSSQDAFVGKRVIVTEKMDGENTSIYSDTVHARSIDGRNHPSRNWVKRFAQDFQWMLGDDMRVCGENLYAQHSIVYDSLDSYFLGFSTWYKDTCMCWDSTVAMMRDLGIEHVSVLYDGIYDEATIRSKWNDGDSSEGYVVRLASSFQMSEFPTSVGKCVRANHVQTDKHWMSQEIVPNKLR